MQGKLLIGILIGGALGALLGHFGKCTSGTCPLTANPLRGAIYGAVLGALFAFSSGSRQPLPEGGAPHITSEEELVGIIRSGTPCLIDFYSERCPPCRRLIPVINQLATDYEGRAIVRKVNIGRSPQLAEGWQIQSIPTVIFFKDGKEAGRRTGLQPKESYENALNRLIGAAEPAR
jgi:thioredoxin 1